MRETSFIRQNKEKWKEFEQILARKDRDPEELNELFIKITDDLSYSRTFYPNRSVRVYLNSLAQQIFYSLYKNKKTGLGRLFSFWSDELPQLIHHARAEFRLAFFLFALAFLIGIFSSAMDPEFPRAILGDSYVNMSLENIESGDPMAVYKQRGEFGMSLGITANNLFVAFLTFVLGVFFAIGSAAILLSNGVMVGAFQYFFYEHGLLRESFLTIWMHGTLEISAIIIAGAAGLTMGKGLVFPGTYTRLQAFQISARRGLKIMIGIAPIILLAGFIEGYLTRYTETADIVRALFILICLSFVLGYFVWYPWYLARRGFSLPVQDTQIPPESNLQMDLSRIKTSAEIFANIFVLYKRHLQYIIRVALSVAAIFCLAVFPFVRELPAIVFTFNGYLFASLFHLNQFFLNEEVPFLPIINILIYSISMLAILQLICRTLAPSLIQSTPTFLHLLNNLLKVMMATSTLVLITITNDWYTFLLFISALPPVLLWAFVMIHEQLGPLQAISRCFFLIKGSYVRLPGLFILMLAVSLLSFMIIDSSFLWFYYEVIGWNLNLEQETLNQVGAVLITFINIVALSLMFPFFLIGTALLYFTLVEIKEAPGLQRKVEQIGIGKRIQGMEKEITAG